MQIHDATGGLPTTDETHAVGKLVAVYTVHHLIGCALPDRTPHRDGYVIVTACGLTLNIGRDCGRKWIRGLDAVIARDAEIYALERDKNMVLAADRLVRACESTYQEGTLAALVVRTMTRYVPELVSLASDIARGRAENHFEFARRDIEGRRMMASARLEGIQLFGASPDFDELARRSRRVAAAREEVIGGTTESRIRGVARDVRVLRTMQEEAQRWLDASRRFFGPRNLAIALHFSGASGATVNDDVSCIVTREGIGISFSRGILAPDTF